jgi:hypothetical protein
MMAVKAVLTVCWSENTVRRTQDEVQVLVE